MDDRRNSDPVLDSALFTGSYHRSSGSFQSSSSGGDYPIGQNRSSSGGGHSNEDIVELLRHQFSVANSRIKGQELRVADTEAQIAALTNHLKLVNDHRVAAVQDAAKANEELRLYKIRLESAHQEIRRAQEIIDRIEQERYDAEKAAAEARKLARRYQRDLLVMKAMEEGRKLGMQEGFEQGRALGLGETDMSYEQDMSEQGYADEYPDYAEAESRPLSLQDVVHPPMPQPAIPESVSPPPPRPDPPLQSLLVPPPQPQPPPQSQPIPVPPPAPIQPIPITRRSPSPSVIYQPISIPPDGYIPTIDSDNVIRIPPPHELAKPPPTPERPASPQLPDVAQEEPRPVSQSHRRRRSSSSLASASTAVGTLGRATPLSAIPEAQTPYISPAAQDADCQTLRRQPSQISSRSVHRRQSVESNVSGVVRPSSSNQEDRRKSAVPSGVPDINIVPPTLSEPSIRSQNNVNPPLGGEDISRPSSMVNQLFGNRVIGQTGPSTSGAVGEIPILTPQPGRNNQLYDTGTNVEYFAGPPYEDHGTGWEDAVRLAGSQVPVPQDNWTTRPASRNTDGSNK